MLEDVWHKWLLILMMVLKACDVAAVMCYLLVPQVSKPCMKKKPVSQISEPNDQIKTTRLVVPVTGMEPVSGAIWQTEIPFCSLYYSLLHQI